jgi:hypothetical protein
MRRVALLLMLVVGMGSGCARLPIAIAPSTEPIEGRTYRNLGRVARTDSAIYLLGFIPLTGGNSTRDAIDACIRSKRGDAMINVAVEAYGQWWILFLRYATRVDGDVIRFE